MQITPAQAKTIGAKLYIRTKNQEHLEEWCKGHITKEQAHDILNVIMKLKYDLAKNDPMEHERIQNWGREQVKALGYTEPQINPSL